MARDYSKDKHTEERAARDAAICAAVRDDTSTSLSLQQLADKFNLTISGICNILRKNGMKKSGHRKGAQTARDAAICAAVRADPYLSLQQLGDQFGMSFSGVWGVLQKNGMKKPHLRRARQTVVRVKIAKPRDYSKNKHTEARNARNATIYATACADRSLSLQQLADKFGMSLANIRRILRKSGMLKKPRPTHLPANRARDAAICAAARTDPAPSLQQIGDRFGMSINGVYHVLLSYGMTKPRPAHNPVNRDRNAIICTMAEDDMSLSQIGDQMGLSTSAVGSILHNYGDIDYSGLVQTRKQESHTLTTAKRELSKLQATIRRTVKARRVRVTVNGERTPEAIAYKNMFKRGGTVCERWKGKDGFQNFYNDLGPRPPGVDANGKALHAIHCIDDYYSPETVTWALRRVL